MCTHKHHYLPGNHLGPIVQVFNGPLLCLSSGPDFPDLGRKLEVPSPPVICSPSWAHPKGPEAAQIPWTSSSVQRCFPVMGGPPSPPHHCTDIEHTHFPRVGLHSSKTTLSFLQTRTRSFTEPSPWGCSVTSPGNTVSLRPRVLAVLEWGRD